MKKLLTLMALVVLSTTSVQSLTIVCDFKGDGPSNTVGSGNWTNLCVLAARVWETAFPGSDATIVIHFASSDAGDFNIAKHDLETQGGVPCRETEGAIVFKRNLGGVPWYMDPNPLDSCNYIEVTTNLGCTIKASRCRDLTTPGMAWDFFNVALHEIGHSLNMSFRGSNFIAQSASGSITITNGSHAGIVVPLQRNGDGNIVSHTLDIVPNIVTSGTFMWNTRVLPSVLDITLLGFLSGFDKLNTELIPVLKIGRPTDIAGRPMPKIVELSWIQPMPAPAGTVYRVQMCTDLNTDTWVTVEEGATVTGGVYRLIVPANGARALFRLSAEPIAP